MTRRQKQLDQGSFSGTVTSIFLNLSEAHRAAKDQRYTACADLLAGVA